MRRNDDVDELMWRTYRKTMRFFLFMGLIVSIARIQNRKNADAAIGGITGGIIAALAWKD